METLKRIARNLIENLSPLHGLDKAEAKQQYESEVENILPHLIATDDISRFFDRWEAITK